MIREIEVIKEWYAAPGGGKEGEVRDDECAELLLRLNEARREDRVEKHIKKVKELWQQALSDAENITKEDLEEAYQQAILEIQKEKK